MLSPHWILSPVPFGPGVDVNGDEEAFPVKKAATIGDGFSVALLPLSVASPTCHMYHSPAHGANPDPKPRALKP